MTRALIITPAILLLAACAGGPATKTVEVFRAPPAQLLECQPSPEVPHAKSQADVARYVVKLHDAGADCRSKLGAVKNWTEKQKKISP